MADVNRAAYAASHRLISAGCWIVDSVAGTITGTRYGKVLGSLQPRWGYVQLAVHENGKRIGYVFAHRLIWEHMHGMIPDGAQINHRNGVKHDNRLANLELLTPSDNVKHAHRTGLHSLKGTRNNNAKLTERDVQTIRAALTSGEAGRSVARRYGVATTTISKIRLGKRWQHVALDI